MYKLDIKYKISFYKEIKTYLYKYLTNMQVIKTNKLVLRTSETIRMLSNINYLNKNSNSKFKEWVAGLTDGDGNFYISKKGYVEFSVVTETRDSACLYKLQEFYGGYVKPYKNGKAVRFRLHDKKGLLNLMEDLNGLILNPIRLEQYINICKKYNLAIKDPHDLVYSSAYLSGLFDSDGSIYYNKQSKQMFLTITQKHKFILEKIAQIYGGKIYSSNSKKTAYKWTLNKKNDVLNIYNNYFKVNECISAKNLKFKLITDFYYLSSSGALNFKTDSNLNKDLYEFVPWAENWKKINNST